MADRKSINDIQEEEFGQGLDTLKSSNPVTLYRTYSTAEATAIEKRLVRKLDTRILPTIVLIYILNYVSALQVKRKTIH